MSRLSWIFFDYGYIETRNYFKVKLSWNISWKNAVDIIYDEKLEDVDFVNEMTITYKNTLSTKLGNHGNSTSKSSVSSKKRNKRECSGWIKESLVTINKHNAR